MASAAMVNSVPETTRVWLRPAEGGSDVQVDGKDESICVRQLLVRRGLHCTFPSPLWKRSRYAFHVAHPTEMPLTEIERIVAAFEGVELQRDRA